jgi:hypothetical protein
MMRGRFGRRRWGGGGGDAGDGGGLDVAQELARVLRSGLVPADALEPAGGDDVPAALAAVGVGTSRAGERLVVGVAPEGGAAWLGALAVASRLAAEEGFAGTALAISARWPLAARRRLGLLRATPFGVEARRESVASRPEGDVEAEPIEPPLAAADAAAAPRRELFERAVAALAGLAAKHGGALRPAPSGPELVLLGRTAAALRGDAGGVTLEVREPRREQIRLAPDGLADALDRLEGSLRKFLGDRRMREGEAGVRWTVASALVAELDLREARRWPLPEPLPAALDWAGLDAEGRPVAAAAAGTLGLAGVGPLLDAWTAFVPRVPALFAHAAPAGARPRLVVAAERIDAAAARVLALVDVDLAWLEASLGGRAPAFTPRPLPAPLAGARPAPARAVEPVAQPERPEPTPARVAAAPAPRELASTGPAAEVGPTPEGDTAPGAPRRRFEEFSLFDLGEGGGDEGAAGEGRRRRRRRRGRGRSRGAGTEEETAEGEGGDEEEPAPALEREPEREAARGPRERGRRGRARGRRDRERDRDRERPPAAAAEEEPLGEDEDADEDEGALLDEAIAELAEVPELETPEPIFEEDDEEEAEPESEEQRRLREEREKRRRARLAKGDPEPEAKPPPRPPRRRAAILAHADRESIAAAVLLARDLRLIEGIWIYPQSELMHFFRTVATDLREDTPIVVVGFTASPARETCSRPRRCTATGWSGSTTTSGRPRTSSGCARRSARTPSTSTPRRTARSRSRSPRARGAVASPTSSWTC